MKCPYRKITNYSKDENFHVIRQEGGIDHYKQRVPCSADTADQIIEDFADCLKLECPLYREGDICLKGQEG